MIIHIVQHCFAPNVERLKRQIRMLTTYKLGRLELWLGSGKISYDDFMRQMKGRRE